MNSSWLAEQIVQAAALLKENGAAHRFFDRVVAAKLREQPVSRWEEDRWTRGLQRGLIRLDGHRFRLGSGRQSSFGFFVRNDKGIMVGLHREALTQAAAYVSLVTDYGHPRRRVRFEIDYMDVALRDARGRVLLYAESKAADRTLERLLGRLAGDFEAGLPPVPEDRLPPDAWQKAQHILRNRPEHFWGVAPNTRRAFRVAYRGPGFLLEELRDLPASGESLLRSSVAPRRSVP